MDIRKYFTKANITLQTESQTEVKTEVKTEKKPKLSQKREKLIKVFTDGSSFNNGLKGHKHYGGIGIFFGDNHDDNTSVMLEESNGNPVTNNIAELKACIMAIEIINDNVFNNYDKIIIYTDSEYTIKSITQWAKNWEKNNWKRMVGNKLKDIRNKELIMKLYNLYKSYTIEFRHVRAHRTKPRNENSEDYFIWYGNMMADKLAREASHPKYFT